MKIGDTIRTIRLKRGFKQSWTEKQAGLPGSTLSKIEKGTRDAKFSELENLAKVLDVRVIDLITWPVRYVPEEGDNCRVRAVIELDLADEQRLRVLKDILHNEHLI